MFQIFGEILDFSRYKYDAKKRQQEAKKKQKRVALKEMKFKVNIGQGDFDVKLFCLSLHSS